MAVWLLARGSHHYRAVGDFHGQARRDVAGQRAFRALDGHFRADLLDVHAWREENGFFAKFRHGGMGAYQISNNTSPPKPAFLASCDSMMPWEVETMAIAIARADRTDGGGLGVDVAAGTADDADAGNHADLVVVFERQIQPVQLGLLGFALLAVNGGKVPSILQDRGDPGLTFENGTQTRSCRAACAFVIRVNMSESGSIIGVVEGYQLDLRTPRKQSWPASSRKQIRQSWNCHVSMLATALETALDGTRGKLGFLIAPSDC